VRHQIAAVKRGAGEFNRPIGLLNSPHMSTPAGSSTNTALAPRSDRELLSSSARRRSVKPTSKHWQPPEGLTPEDVQAVIAAATCERDRLLLTTLWATGARISEILALRPRDARVRQIVRHTRSLPLAQKQAGWARLHPEYLTLRDEEARHLMRDVPE
jgi:integrase